MTAAQYLTHLRRKSRKVSTIYGLTQKQFDRILDDMETIREASCEGYDPRFVKFEAYLAMAKALAAVNSPEGPTIPSRRDHLRALANIATPSNPAGPRLAATQPAAPPARPPATTPGPNRLQYLPPRLGQVSPLNLPESYLNREMSASPEVIAHTSPMSPPRSPIQQFLNPSGKKRFVGRWHKQDPTPGGATPTQQRDLFQTPARSPTAATPARTPATSNVPRQGAARDPTTHGTEHTALPKGVLDVFLKAIPTFQGSRNPADVQSWITKMDRFFTNDSRARNDYPFVIIVNKLSGAAEAWFRSRENEFELQDVDYFMNAFHEEYMPAGVEESTKEVLARLRQTTIVAAYVALFQNACALVPDLPEAYKLDMFRLGLDPTLKAQIRLQFGELEYSSFSEYVRLATYVDKLMNPQAASSSLRNLTAAPTETVTTKETTSSTITPPRRLNNTTAATTGPSP